VRIPDGIDDAKIRKALLEEYNLEIGGGLGVLKGKIWRVGLMGYSSSEANVLYFLTALEQTLREQGFEVPQGRGPTAAREVYKKK
jgi:alanine-glyoxylate transaminase/serine-glyoxylate transaminase/serine-pyruvate transaminase